jgi:hypothetical protein
MDSGREVIVRCEKLEEENGIRDQRILGTCVFRISWTSVGHKHLVLNINENGNKGNGNMWVVLIF